MSKLGVLRQPAGHFLLIGGLLFGFEAWRAPTRGGDLPLPERRIVLTAADLERLRHEWLQTHGTAPDATAERRMIDRAIDEEILVREALARGLDRQDRAVRGRLAALMGYLGDSQAGDPAGGEGEAVGLGLEGRDPVVRRHLAQALRLQLAALPAAQRPSSADLEAHRVRHAERFAQPARVRFRQVFLARERHASPSAAEAEAGRLLADLLASGAGPDAAQGRGDPFILGPSAVDASRADLERLFGADFAAALCGADERRWVGPIASSWGFHLVWVEERLPAQAAAIPWIESRVGLELLAQRRAERLHEALGALRSRYDVVIEGAVEPGSGDRSARP